MKKLTILFAAVMFSITAAFSQPVSDMGIIPVGVTLNSILRLNITNGGSIEYVVNTMDQYTTGVSNSPGYTTTFTVASSVDFNVNLYADNSQFTGVDVAGLGANTMPLDHLAYFLTDVGGSGATLTPANPGFADLAQASSTIVAGPAGDIVTNQYSVSWELGTGNTSAGSVLGLAADRYVVNVFLELQPQ